MRLIPALLCVVLIRYDEIQYYNYSNPAFSAATGHFTQLIWRRSGFVGCAYVYCNNGLTNFAAGRFQIVCR